MEGGIWWIIIGAVIALAVGIIVLFIVSGGLNAGGENIDILSSCKTQGGKCEPGCDPNDPDCTSACGSDKREFYRFGGCPDDKENKNTYCCIPK